MIAKREVRRRFCEVTFIGSVSNDEAYVFQSFEWNYDKRLANLNKHGIDFVDAIAAFDGPLMVLASPRRGETRHLALGEVEGRVLAIAFTIRKDVCRLISARPASKDERKAYDKTFPRGG